MNKTDKFAFVIMPFAQEFTQAYKDLIKPSIENCGINCIRADEDAQGNIHQQMMQKIFDADVLVADITGLNPNVFYELGVAHAISKKTVVICNGAQVNKIPFDIAPYRILSYNLNKEELMNWRNALQEEIMTVIESSVSEGIPNPVQDYLSSRTIANTKTSFFLESLHPSLENDLLLHCQSRLVYFGLTGYSFSNLVEGMFNQGRGSALKLDLALLDPKAEEYWKYIYMMRFGKDYTDAISHKNMLRDSMNQEEALETLYSIEKRHKGLKLKIRYYRFLPSFWGYHIDDEKWVVGNYIFGRSSSRSFPVNVLSKQDINTQSLYDYYDDISDEIFKS